MDVSLGQPDAEPRHGERVDVSAALAVHGRWLRTVLAARGVDRTALDDAMQSLCAAALRGAAQLRDPQRVGPWLYRIAVVEALQYRRRTGRRRRLVERYTQQAASAGEAAEYDPLAWLLANETQQLVRQAIARLAPQDAEMLLLKYTEDWSYKELADRMGISVSAVEARLHRARGKLRSTLAKLAPDLVAEQRRN